MKHKETCGKCGHVTKPQSSPGIARRVLATHMWMAHGIRGKKYDTNRKYKKQRAGVKRPYKRKPKIVEPDVIPIRLESCPVCASRFYASKGQP